MKIEVEREKSERSDEEACKYDSTAETGRQSKLTRNVPAYNEACAYSDKFYIFR